MKKTLAVIAVIAFVHDGGHLSTFEAHLNRSSLTRSPNRQERVSREAVP